MGPVSNSMGGLPPWLLALIQQGMGGGGDSGDAGDAGDEGAPEEAGGGSPYDGGIGNLPKKPVPTTPPFLPGRIPGFGTPPTPIVPGPAPAPQQAPTPAPQQGGLRSRIGDMLQSGIDAAATPNVAYGGPVDIMRGLQSADVQRRNRALQQMQLERQRQQDELVRRNTESEIAARGENTETLRQQREATAAQRQELAQPRHGQIQIDAAYAKENLPWLRPDPDGTYWVSKEVANTLSKPEKPDKTPKPSIVPPGATVVDENGKVLFTAPPKDTKEPPNVTEAQLAWMAEHDPDPQVRKDSKAALKGLASTKRESTVIRVNEGQQEKISENRAINQAFNDAGGDWNKVLDNVRAGKYPDYGSQIADHAQKMAKLPSDSARRVASADATVDQVKEAIDAVKRFTTAHPDLVGPAINPTNPMQSHPLNALTRRAVTAAGAEPADIGEVDTALESALALQPGQHNFRSQSALDNFKKAAGVDPRTGKADGSRGWLVNPDKVISALQGISDFNQKLKRDIISTTSGGTPATGGHPAGRKASPAAALPPEAKAKLKEGVHTTFANGQTWMLQGGQPVQVQ
ncbi:MAG TPA: hypothetical protein VNL17_14405 [Verrucomicrobiae bacterium]|nr:hypothetical protein [Verrucomicrobiae bacterium]